MLTTATAAATAAAVVTAPARFADTDDAPPSASTCLIKGNISSSGAKIYHSPGQRHYDDTRVDLAKGERWFCTAADAEAAGWRAAKV